MHARPYGVVSVLVLLVLLSRRPPRPGGIAPTGATAASGLEAPQQLLTITPATSAVDSAPLLTAECMQPHFGPPQHAQHGTNPDARVRHRPWVRPRGGLPWPRGRARTSCLLWRVHRALRPVR